MMEMDDDAGLEEGDAPEPADELALDAAPPPEAPPEVNEAEMLRQQVEQLRGMLDQRKHAIKTVARELIQPVVKRHQVLQHEHEDLKRKLAEALSRPTTVNAPGTGARETEQDMILTQLRSELSVQQRVIKSLESDNMALRREHAAMGELKSQLEAQRQEADTFLAENEELRRQMNEVETTGGQMQQRFSQIKDQLDNATAQITALQEALSAIEAEKAEADQQSVSFKMVIADQQNEMHQIKRQMQAGSEHLEMQRLATENEALQREAQRAQLEVDKAQAEGARCMAEAQQYQAQMENLKAEAARYRQRYLQMKDELNEFLKVTQDLRKQEINTLQEINTMTAQ